MGDDLRELLRFLMDCESTGDSTMGYTALHHAAMSGNKRMVQLLLKYGARTDHISGMEFTESPDWCQTPLQETVYCYGRMRGSAFEIVRKKAEENYPDIIAMLEEAEKKGKK